MILRDFRDTDGPPTLDVFLRAIRVTASVDYSPDQVAVWARSDIDVAAWTTKRAAAGTIVAEIDDNVVGFTDLDASGYIDMLFVAPDFGRRGVASALLGRVFELARFRSLPVLTVHASVTARPFFESVGFVIIDERHPVRNGVTLVNFDMRRVL